VLSTFGSVRWNFEALLRQEFGNRPVCVIGSEPGTPFRFTGFPVNVGCSPLSTYEPYFYVFATSGKSAFHLTNVRYRTGQEVAGNYPVPVLVRGRLIACNREDTRVLIEYSDSAGFALACVVSAILK
jgi:hypothetical protein